MIHFNTVRFKNFLSTGNQFIEIPLNKSSDTLIIGENGSGKSTVLDALCFGLFGKPFRNINKPQLVNSVNNGGTMVEIEFKIGSKKYKVTRGIKPNLFEVYRDETLLNQDANIGDYQEYLEKTVLKLNFKSFTQIVILVSSSFVPFMQLKSSDRRSIIEDLLDIQIFSTMNVLLKDKSARLQEAITTNKSRLELAEELIKTQQRHLESSKATRQELMEETQEFIDTDEKYLIEEEVCINELLVKVKGMQKAISDEAEIKNDIKKLTKYQTQIETNISHKEKEHQFFVDHEDCPTCKQVIDGKFKGKIMDECEEFVTEKRDALELGSKLMDTKNSRLQEIQKVQEEVSEHQKDILRRQVETKTTIESITTKKRQIEKWKTEKSGGEKIAKQELDRLKEELKNKTEEREECSKTRSVYNVANELLKDSGIKARVIKNYLPIINKLVNKYLTSLDFYVDFQLDENFRETVKSRFRDEFSYDAFSEGEKMRIDLALLFTWRTIAKLKNSTNTNLLILDEVFDSSLDSTGTEEFLKIIKSLGKKSNVFVISHKGEVMYDKFDQVLKFQKEKNFGKMVEA